MNQCGANFSPFLPTRNRHDPIPNIVFGVSLKKSPMNGDVNLVTMSSVPMTDIRLAISNELYLKSSRINGVIMAKFNSEKSVIDVPIIVKTTVTLWKSRKSKFSTIQSVIVCFLLFAGIALISSSTLSVVCLELFSTFVDAALS